MNSAFPRWKLVNTARVALLFCALPLALGMASYLAGCAKAPAGPTSGEAAPAPPAPPPSSL
jgi:hypothetical protein